jgi:hypothetical protein
MRARGDAIDSDFFPSWAQIMGPPSPRPATLATEPERNTRVEPSTSGDRTSIEEPPSQQQHHITNLLWMLNAATSEDEKERIIRRELPGRYSFPSSGAAPVLSHFTSPDTKGAITLLLAKCVTDPHWFERAVVAQTFESQSLRDQLVASIRLNQPASFSQTRVSLVRAPIIFFWHLLFLMRHNNNNNNDRRSGKPKRTCSHWSTCASDHRFEIM